MIDSSNLRGHAEAIRRMALAVSNEETKACLMALAKLWASTAHDVEQNARAAEMRNAHCKVPHKEALSQPTQTAPFPLAMCKCLGLRAWNFAVCPREFQISGGVSGASTVVLTTRLHGHWAARCLLNVAPNL
jgi:hypothetical protein